MSVRGRQMQEKTLKLEISNPTESGKVYYGTLALPASELEIEDSMQQIRTTLERQNYESISIYECNILPQLTDSRLDTLTMKELNFFAKRLASLNEEEQLVLQAVAPKYIGEDIINALPVSIKTLINLTYGLEKVPIISAVSTDKELGEFVIENDLHPDLEKLPAESRSLLDRTVVGKWMRENDGGVFIKDKYVVAGEYELMEVYDGISLPLQEQEERYVFRINVAATDSEKSAQWLSLPIKRIEADRLAKLFGAEKIEECACIGFESVMPQIEEKDIQDLSGFMKLNFIASQYMKMSPENRMKYKAVLNREKNFSLGYAEKSLSRLEQYELDPKVEYADDYFRKYLYRHLDIKFDARWLDDVNFMKEGQVLKERTGAAITPYGIISSPGGSLYTNIPRRREESIQDEKLEVVEFFGQNALFSDTRLKQSEIPKGFYRYELRDGDNGNFASIEERVFVNHAGTLLMREPIDLGKNGYLELDDDSTLNFLGYEQTIKEFLEEQTELAEQVEGGIKQ